MTKEQKDLAETIARANGGCVAFNLSQAAKIAGRSRNNFPHWLQKHGIMVENSGREKYVNVNDLVVAMTAERTSPV